MSTLGSNITAAMKKRIADEEAKINANGSNSSPAAEQWDYDTTVPRKPKDESEGKWGRVKKLLGIGPKVAMK